MNIVFFNYFFEIKARLIYLSISFIFTILTAAIYFEDLIFLLIKPLIENDLKIIKPYHFIFTEVTEAFETTLLFSVGFSSILIIPFSIYHFWAYAIPSFYIKERNELFKYCFFFVIFLIISNLINYCLIIPQIWSFFINYETKNNLLSIQHETRILSSIKFLFGLLWWFIMLGQLPIIIYWLISKNWISWTNLKTKRRYFWIFSVLIASIFSIPEMYTQIITMCLLISFVEFMFFITILSNNYELKKKKKL